MRKSSKQFTFNHQAFEKPKLAFGGRRHHGKIKRPLDSNLPLHVTLRSNHSVMRLYKVFGKIENILQQVSNKYGVKVYEYANVGNHLHLLVRCPKRANWNAFIRELTGRIALLVKLLEIRVKQYVRDCLREPQTIATKTKFWACSPHTRIVTGWKKAFKAVKDYIIFNQWEAEGHINRNDFKNPRAWREFLGGLPQLQ